MTTEEAIRGLAEEARRIGKQHTAQASAWEEAVRAEADLLAAIIHAVEPALGAVCSRVEMKQRAGLLTPAPWKGVRLAGSLMEGRLLYLNEAGALIEMNISWGKHDSWEGKWCPMTARHVVIGFKLETIIDALTRALSQQHKGGAAARTAILESRAAQLQVVTSMLRGLKK